MLFYCNKSAPYPRLKNSTRTSKCQVFCSTEPEKHKLDQTGALKGIVSHPFCCKISKKIKRGQFGDTKQISKSLTMPKKLKGGDPLVSSGIVWGGTTFIVEFPRQMVQFGPFKFRKLR